MKPRDSQSGFCKPVIGSVTAVLCAIVILTLGPSLVLAQQVESQVMTTTTPTGNEAPKISGAQLDSLVAPMALYSDELLAQTLAASTYPLEIIQLQQWMERNKNLKDKALADAVTKQPWDPSIQAMAAFPDVVQRLAGNIQWTTDLGNAFLAQQSDVMDAVQRMRAKAQGKGTLKTSAQQKVETKTEGGKQVIVVEQADPQVVYVPSYDPVVVYGEPEYPYYPYEYPGYYPGMGLAWGAGLALGAAWGGGWGWGCGWGNGDVNVNWNNKYVNHYNQANNVNRGQGNNWQHHPEHRGNAPYGDRNTANRFGGRGPGGVGGADASGEFDEADAGHDDQAVDGQGQQVGGGAVFAVAGGDAGHVPVGHPGGDAGDGGGGDQAGGGQAAAVDRYPGDQLHGQQQGQRGPCGDHLAHRVALGVQDVRGHGRGDAEHQRGADGPADSAKLWKWHDVRSSSGRGGSTHPGRTRAGRHPIRPACRVPSMERPTFRSHATAVGS